MFGLTLTVDQLKEKAKGLGISGVASMNKAALIAAIEKAEKPDQFENENKSHSEGESQMGEHKKFDKFK